ncbi:MAG: SpoIID/LytB domain-containing protein [Gemmatimonadaceae bacterium]
MRAGRVGWRWRVVGGLMLALPRAGGGGGLRPLTPATGPAAEAPTPSTPPAPPSPPRVQAVVTAPPRDAAAPLDEAPPSPALGEGPSVRVALTVHAGAAPLRASGAWRLLDEDGRVIVRGDPRDQWSLERRGRQLRAVRADGLVSAWHAGPVTLRGDGAGTVRSGTRAYRGVLRHVATDSGVLVVNVLPLEDYLRGVVPLEIGDRPPTEREAVEAQAIAARTYTVRRLMAERRATARRRGFDLLSTVADQVYGGVGAERGGSDQAIARTRGLVLLVGGQVADAPFFSTCGGRTAAATEVWVTTGASHLRGVSDRIPGSTRDYCEGSPTYRWTRQLTTTELDRVVQRYLARVTAVPRGGPGAVQRLRVVSTAPSGRVGRLELRTAAGTFTVPGNAARSVLRSAGGDLLPSAYFSLAVEEEGGRLVRAVVEGRGAGHGVGMCQWGAIGRARAGQDHRAILSAYYPGATVARLPAGLIPS